MNYNKACHILNLNDNFSTKELKETYYKLALKFHPDRNLENDTTKKFQEIQSAFNYLQTFHNSDLNTDLQNNISYTDLVKQFLDGIINKNLDSECFLNLINNKCNEITIDLFKTLPKTTLLNFKNIVDQYSHILNINNDITNKIDDLVNECTKDDNIILLNPTLSNLINDEVYKLDISGEIFYIPYWHHELIYDLSSNSLIVQCEPKLPSYINIDKYNNLYINISTSIISIINTNNIDILIDNKKFYIPIKELKIIKYQRYTILNQGIPMINTNNIYSIHNRGSIYIDITFTDID